MGSLSFLDSVLNVCRSIWDVLHILTYLIFAIIAFLYGFRKSDRESYNRYIYEPIKNFLIKNFLIKIFTKLIFVFRVMNKLKPSSVELKSNRKLYRGRKK